MFLKDIRLNLMEIENTAQFCIKCGKLLDKKEIEGKKRPFCPDCGWTYYRNPLPSVAAFVKKENSVLLIKRGVEPMIGEWALPSGFLEIDESAKEGCIRELEEETGLKGKVKKLIDVNNEKSSLYGNVLVIGYEVEVTGGVLKPGSDTKEVRFFPINEIPTIPFKSHKGILEKGIKITEKTHTTKD